MSKILLLSLLSVFFISGCSKSSYLKVDSCYEHINGNLQAKITALSGDDVSLEYTVSDLNEKITPYYYNTIKYFKVVYPNQVSCDKFLKTEEKLELNERFKQLKEDVEVLEKEVNILKKGKM